MARKKKQFNYEFIDCNMSFPSSIEVICTQTKEKVRMYHKQLARLIQLQKVIDNILFQAICLLKIIP
mgnify:CR=1 FL=1